MGETQRNDRRRALLIAAPRLTAWFAANRRVFPWRESRTPYKVLVSETMLQQTRIEAVLKYYERFMKAFPTLRALAGAPEDLVMKHWEGLGYYSRARNLKKCAEICAEHHDGKLPETYAELIRLPGLGPYSAGAVASLCHDEAVPAVDGNVLRVLARFFGDARDVRLPEVRKEAEDVIRAVLEDRTSSVSRQGTPSDEGEGRVSPSAFNEALMELGEQITADYAGRSVRLVCILRGAVFFTCELAKRIKLPVSFDFMSVSSYGSATTSSGIVRILKDLEDPLTGEDVIVVEDIIDSGRTLNFLQELFYTRGAASVRICTLLDKPSRRAPGINIHVDYRGFEVPDAFVVGWGMDYDQRYRNLPYIGVIRQ